MTNRTRSLNVALGFFALLFAGCGQWGPRFNPPRTNASYLFGSADRWQSCSAQTVNDSGTKVAWPVTELPLTIQIKGTMPNKFKKALNDAIIQWNAIRPDPLFELHNIQAGSPDIKISFVNDWHFESDDKVATTLLQYHNDQIVGANIYLNSAQYHFSTHPHDQEIDFATVMLHELGHSLGFAHTNENSIMQPDVPFARKLGLTDYDAIAVQCAYQ